MPKAAACKMVVGNFDDEFRVQGDPFAGLFSTPSAGPAGSAACKAGWLDQGLELRGERIAIASFDSGGKADVVEQAVLVI